MPRLKKKDSSYILPAYYFSKLCYRIGIFIVAPFRFLLFIVSVFFRILKWAIPFIKMGVIVFFAILFSYKSWVFLSSVPTPKTVKNFPLPKKIKVYDRNNTPLYEAYGYSSYQIPQYTFSKKVFDILTPNTLSNLRIAKAIAENYFFYKKSGSFQLLEKYVMAIKLSFSMDREGLSGLYLNTSPFGEDAIGVEAASRMFFGKKTSELSPAELVFLSGLLDFNYPKSMRPPYGIYKRAPLAIDYVLKTIKETYRERFARSHDLSVYTTIDAAAQSRFQQRYFELEGIGLPQQDLFCIVNANEEIIAVVGSQSPYSGNGICSYFVLEQEFEKKSFLENSSIKKEEKSMSRLISKIVNEN